MKKRFLALILGTVMTASLIVGCGGKSSGNSGSAPADADAARSSRLRSFYRADSRREKHFL